MRRWKRLTAAIAVGLLPIGGLIGVGASTAAAAPSNAPTAISGTFDCGSAGSGTFVVNSGKANAPTTWNTAHLKFTAGGTGVFVPNAFDLTFSVNGQSMTEHVSKKGPAGNAVCTISASQGPFSLSGQVRGKIVKTG